MRFLSAILCAFMLAWGGQVQAAPLEKVTIVLTSETPTMNPHTESNFIGTIIWRWAYDTLVSSETGTGKIGPWLAERWEKLGPTQMKFYLRKDAKFSDGTPVTAAAVKYSIDNIVAPETKSRQFAYFKEYKSIEILDDHTFIWHSKSIDNGLLHRIARWGHIVNPKAKGMEGNAFSQGTFGSGPYVMKSWVKGQRMVLEASPTWWGKSKYPDMPKTVIVRAIQERSTRVKALLADEVDIVAGVPPHMTGQIKENPKKAVVTTPGVRIMYLNYTQELGPLADVNVRRAISHAINMESILKTIMGGLAEPTGQLFHPWSFAGYLPDKNAYPYPYDPAKAKALMKSSKYPDGFKVTIYTAIGRYPGDKETCEALPGMLKAINIDATCKPMNYALFTNLRRAYIAKKEKEPAMFYQGFGNSAGDPALITRALMGCKGAWSYMCDKELDALTDKAINTADDKTQDMAFQKVMSYIHDKALVSVFFQIHDVYGFDKGIAFKARHDEIIYPWELSARK